MKDLPLNLLSGLIGLRTGEKRRYYHGGSQFQAGAQEEGSPSQGQLARLCIRMTIHFLLSKTRRASNAPLKVGAKLPHLNRPNIFCL